MGEVSPAQALHNALGFFLAVSAEELAANLTCVSPHLNVYLTRDVPKRLHYSNNPRIDELVAVMDDTWAVDRWGGVGGGGVGGGGVGWGGVGWGGAGWGGAGRGGARQGGVGRGRVGWGEVWQGGTGQGGAGWAGAGWWGGVGEGLTTLMFLLCCRYSPWCGIKGQHGWDAGFESMRVSESASFLPSFLSSVLPHGFTRHM